MVSVIHTGCQFFFFFSSPFNLLIRLNEVNQLGPWLSGAKKEDEMTNAELQCEKEKVIFSKLFTFLMQKR